MQLSCKHILHTECGLGWIIEKKTCPLCRQKTLAKKHLPHAEDAPVKGKIKKADKDIPTSVRRHRRVIQRESHRRETSSGFMQPVRISAEMAKFTGRNRDKLHSRLDITKFICQYIKNNDLQNPEDRREIIADSRFRKLLNYRDDDEPLPYEPLTYYNLQKHIQKHFSRNFY
jgi:chromatin remodeling complex protein RSC6